jgi:hypothetical protein
MKGEQLHDHLEMLSQRFPDRLWTEHLDEIARDLAMELKRKASRRPREVRKSVINLDWLGRTVSPRTPGGHQ